MARRELPSRKRRNERAKTPSSRSELAITAKVPILKPQRVPPQVSRSECLTSTQTLMPSDLARAFRRVREDQRRGRSMSMQRVTLFRLEATIAVPGAAVQRGRAKTLSRPEAEFGRVHRHIETEGQYVEMHRRSGQAAGHVAAGVPGCTAVTGYTLPDYGLAPPAPHEMDCGHQSRLLQTQSSCGRAQSWPSKTPQIDDRRRRRVR